MNFYKKQLLYIVLIAMWPLNLVFADIITLDFSSGVYSTQGISSRGANLYEQDGFSVRTTDASDAFFNPSFGSLNWYDGMTELMVESSGSLFDLNSLDIRTPAFAGLVFTSSKGENLRVGSISGELGFTGVGWEGIDFFTISKIRDFDILMAMDNITVTTIDVAEPAILALFALGLAGLGGLGAVRRT